jgi:hypothetical protein
LGLMANISVVTTIAIFLLFKKLSKPIEKLEN